jgi:hypothetical protein
MSYYDAYKSLFELALDWYAECDDLPESSAHVARDILEALTYRSFSLPAGYLEWVSHRLDPLEDASDDVARAWVSAAHANALERRCGARLDLESNLEDLSACIEREDVDYLEADRELTHTRDTLSRLEAASGLVAYLEDVSTLEVRESRGYLEAISSELERARTPTRGE